MGTEDTTAQVHPAKLTAAFVAAAERQAGSQVRIGTVTGVRLGGSPGQQHVEGELGSTGTVALAITLRAKHASRHLVCAAAAELPRSTTPHQAWLLTGWCSIDASGVEVDGEGVPADAIVVAMGPWSGQAAKWGLPVPAVRSRSPPPGRTKPLELAAKLATVSCCHVFKAWA